MSKYVKTLNDKMTSIRLFRIESSPRRKFSWKFFSSKSEPTPHITLVGYLWSLGEYDARYIAEKLYFPGVWMSKMWKTHRGCKQRSYSAWCPRWKVVSSYFRTRQRRKIALPTKAKIFEIFPKFCQFFRWIWIILLSPFKSMLLTSRFIPRFFK